MTGSVSLSTDGFRALACRGRQSCRLISPNGHEFARRETLTREIVRTVRCRSAFFYAFDALEINGEDLRSLDCRSPSE